MIDLVCGVDEAGRGPLAGSVYAAAVILDINQPIQGITDSKKLSESKRDALAKEIKQKALAWSVAFSSVEEIDSMNILQASLLAMERAIRSLSIQPDFVQVDGNKCPKIEIPCEAIIKGDLKIQAISAASILAKTSRDAELYELDKQYPEYGFAFHKGYPTQLHLERLVRFGISPVHRLSFRPVKNLVSG